MTEALLVMCLLFAIERKNLKKKIKGLLLQAWLSSFKYSLWMSLWPLKLKVLTVASAALLYVCLYKYSGVGINTVACS